VFAGAAAFVNIGTRFLLSNLTGFGFYPAVTIAYFMGMFVNFILNKNYNFPKGSRHYIHEIRSFTVIALVGLFLTNIFSGFFIYIFRNISFLNGRILETFSHISAVGLVSIYSFFAHKYFTFCNGLRDGVRKIYSKYSDFGKSTD
jgi:putative flippase GtrA